jgi:tetratricopeptide (TPR) repeat protein
MFDEQLTAFAQRLDAFQLHGDPSAVLDPQAVTEAKQLWADNQGPDGGVPLEVVFVVAKLYWLRHQARPGHDDDDLRIAVDLFTALYETAPQTVPYEVTPLLADRLPHLRQTQEAMDILGGPSSTDDPDALVHAISLLRQAIPGYAPRDPLRAVALFNLGTVLRMRFDRDGDTDLLRSAVESFREAAAVPLPEDFPRPDDLPIRYATTSAVLAKATTSLTDLDAAIEANETLAAAGGADRVKRMSELCDLLRTRFEWTGGRAALERAVRFGRAAVDAVAPDDPERATCLSLLSVALRAVAELDRDTDVMAEAVRLSRAAVDLAPRDATLLSNLSATLLGFFTLSENPADVDDAIDAAQCAVDHTDGDRVRTAALSNLAGALRIRYHQLGQLDDLSRAIDALLAAEAAAGTATVRVPVLSNLGNAYESRFSHTGNAADLDGAIRALRSAVGLLTEGHTARLVAIGGLSAALRARFELHRRAADIDLAIQLARDAVTSVSPNGASATLLASLGNALVSRARYTESPDNHAADLDEAVGCFQAALDRVPDAEAGMMVANLGGALLFRFHATQRQADLAAAIDHMNTALTLFDPNDPTRSYLLSNLGNCHRIRFAWSRDPGDLERAATLIGEAADHAPDNDPRRFTVLSNLGHVLETLMRERGGAEDDAMRAVTAWRAAADMLTASAAQRFEAAQNWAVLAASLPGQEVLAADGYAAAVDLLPVVAWRGLERGDRENLLTRSTGLASAAAATALLAGRADQSVDLLEHGRAVQWTQALQLRADLDALRAAAPELANRLDAVRQELDKLVVEIAAPSWQQLAIE